jgi:hypothetical protein
MEISKEELRLIRYHGGMSGHIWEIDREIDKRRHQAEKNPSLNFSKLIEILKEEKKILQTLEQKIENHLFPRKIEVRYSHE